jgi:hypothetical protein
MVAKVSVEEQSCVLYGWIEILSQGECFVFQAMQVMVLVLMK